MQNSTMINGYISKHKKNISFLLYEPISHEKNSLFYSLEQSRLLVKLCKEYSIDKIVSPSGSIAYFTYPLLSRIYGMNLPYFFLMLNDGTNSNSNKIEKFIRKYLLKIARKNSLWTIDHSSMSKSIGIAPDPIQKNNLAKPSNEIKLIFENSKDVTKLVIYGDMSGHKNKNVATLISAVELLNSEELKVKLIIAGAGSDKFSLNSTKRDGDYVICIDKYLTDSELDYITIKSDVVCAPYINHFGPSGIVIRALYYKKRVLVPNYKWFKYISTIIDCGIPFSENTPENIADTIKKNLEFKAYQQNEHNWDEFLRFNSVENYSCFWKILIKNDCVLESQRYSI